MSGWTILGLTLALLGPGVIAWCSRSVVGLTESAPWLAAFVLLTAAVAFIALKIERVPLAEVGLRIPGWETLAIAATLACFFIFAFGPLAAWALGKMSLGDFHARQSALAALPRWYLALTIVIVAAAEEWLYRGYAIGRLAELTGGTLSAGFVSLLCFAVAHFPLWGVGPSLTTLVSGAVLTAAYLWRQDIIALILAHVATDLVGLYFAAPRHA